MQQHFLDSKEHRLKMNIFKKIVENSSFKSWDFTKSESKWIWLFAVISWSVHGIGAINGTISKLAKGMHFASGFQNVGISNYLLNFL